ncbi:MAG TPA: hypothetical protein VEJ38_02180 [Candidatus Acidoferrales bacterium]|nr:hypothetical protein [Candidatus Acidoferrales bacterium]
MREFDGKALLSALVLFVACAASSPRVNAQSNAPASFNVKHVIGLQAVQHNTKGQATVSKDALTFTSGPTKSDLAISGIEDVQTGVDSQRIIGGTIGTLTMVAPYGSGRFLSLFREKIDTLTIEYRDTNGGLHGAIFTLPKGLASALKAQLVAAGAKASPVPAQEATKP